MENIIIKERLEALRKAMEENGIDYYLIPSSDYHNSEYAASFFQTRAYFSGFTGSNGTLLVGRESAGLWTDGRYFVQAGKELAGTGIRLFRMQEPGEPTILEYLKEHMTKGQTLGFDGMTLAAKTGIEFARSLKDREVRFLYGRDLAKEIWKDRPALPCSSAFVLDESYTGKGYAEKVRAVREKMREEGCSLFFLSRLDDICWLTNLRGKDVACNPVVLSHLLLTMDHAYLFLQPEAVTEEVATHCKDNDITIMNYHNIAINLHGYVPKGDVLYDRGNVSYTLFMLLQQMTTSHGRKLVNRPNPTTLMKAVKNETELAHTRKTYLEDSALLTKYIYEIKHNAGKEEMTEYTAGARLDAMRAAREGFLDLSFDTICGYAENGAIVHYKAKKEDCKRIEAKGMLLVDSGATYLGGTTDVTRTIVLGRISDEMKLHFTKTCVAMLRLANARFVYGCTGRNVDTFARAPLWEIGIDYNHGTGHGVGYILNVHEGPQNIRWRMTPDTQEAVLEAGMLVSDEPGVYIEGSHGIRIENILEVRDVAETAHGRFLGFAHLTYVPIDRDAIDASRMEPSDLSALNEYHAQVYEKIAPLIEEEDIRNWLRQVTSPIEI